MEEEGETRAWMFVTRRYFSRTLKESIFYVDREKRATCPSSLLWLFSPGRTKTSADPRREERTGRRQRKEGGQRWGKLCCTAEFIEKMELRLRGDSYVVGGEN